MSIDYEEFFARIKGEHPTNSSTEAKARQTEDVQEPIAQLPEGEAANSKVTTDAQSPLGPKLEKLTGKGLDKADEILSLELDPENGATFGPTLRAQTAVLGQALTTQVRVDEVKLREPRPFKLQELLDLIAEEEKRRPSRLKEVDDSDP
jgi:hypothetical protein